MEQRSRIAALFLLFSLWVAHPALAYQANQFAPSTPTPGVPLDRVEGDFINLETQLIKPIVVVGTGQQARVVVANEPDQRLVVLNADLTSVIAEVFLGQGISALALRPNSNELWVSVRHQMAVMVVNTTTWRVQNLVRPPILSSAIGAMTSDTPGGIAFDSTGATAFVAATSTNTVQAYNAVTKAHISSIELKQVHNSMETSLNQPMALLAVGNRIYVVSHLSGNQSVLATTHPDTSQPPQPWLGGFDILYDGHANASPHEVVVRHLVNDDDPLEDHWSLPDFDVMAIDTVSRLVVPSETIRDVGTILFGIASTSAGELLIANLDSRNHEFRGEAAWPEGRVVRNRVTIVDPAFPVGPHSPLSTDAAGLPDFVAMPTDVIFYQNRIFVAGYGSANIGVYTGSGNYVGTINTDSGPRGLAVNVDLERLYCLNRGDNTVTRFDGVESGPLPAAPAEVFSLPDPTPALVKEGRKLFIDSSFSGAGVTSCGSCHVDARHDGLGWDLSLYFDDREAEGFSSTYPFKWRDRKGVMVTQDLRSLEDSPPFHWRGDRSDLSSFNGAFVGLLKAPNQMTDPEMESFQRFLFATVYPPNPFQQMNRVVSSGAIPGVTAFLDSPPGTGTPCVACHQLPTGSTREHNFTSTSLIGLLPTVGGPDDVPRDMIPTQLRGQWSKSAPTACVWNSSPPPPFPPVPPAPDPDNLALHFPVTGFGFTHDGRHRTRHSFIEHDFPGRPAADLDRFLAELDSGLAPATMYSELVDKKNIASSRIGTFLVPQANSRNCDLYAKGRIAISGAWVDLGLYYDRQTGVFIPDRQAGVPASYTWSTLQSLIQGGAAVLLFNGAPVGMGRRLGIDRDSDGLRDGDEVQTSPVLADTDGDFLWDGSEQDPLDPQSSIPLTTTPPAMVGAPGIPISGTNSIKFVYETDQLSTTSLRFWRSIDPSTSWWFGEQVPLSGLGGVEWKRLHTVYIRPQPENDLNPLNQLIAGEDYVYEIHVQGQGGTSAVIVGPSSIAVAADSQPNNIRTGRVDLVNLSSGGSYYSYQAEVTIVNRLGIPVPSAGLQVNGVWSYEDATGAVHQVAAGTPQFQNNVWIFGLGFITQVPGNRVAFDVPAATPWGQPGVVMTTSDVRFVFGEGETGAEMTAPP